MRKKLEVNFKGSKRIHQNVLLVAGKGKREYSKRPLVLLATAALETSL